MLIHNDNIVKKLVYGGTEEVAWLHNNEAIYIQCAKDDDKDYLSFISLSNGYYQFTNDIEYLMNDGQWTLLLANTKLNTVEGDKVMWRGRLTPISVSPYGIGKFGSSSAHFNIEGNIMSLLFYDEFEDKTDLTNYEFAFRELFEDCNVHRIDGLSLPATTLANYCYSYMFNRCTSLEAIPEGLLPAMTMATSAYCNMFLDCIGITEAPRDLLPATTLAPYCYQGMLARTSLSGAAPELKAATMVEGCYRYMFQHCQGVNEVVCLATNPSTANTHTWLKDVASSGTFYKANGVSWVINNNSGVPVGWTSTNYDGSITRTTSGAAYCDGYDKYQDVYSQVSYDGGETWTTTATTKTLVEHNSVSCGYSPTYAPNMQVVSGGGWSFTGSSGIITEMRKGATAAGGLRACQLRVSGMTSISFEVSTNQGSLIKFTYNGETTSISSGTYTVDGLNPSNSYDITCKLDRTSATILNVSASAKITYTI